MTGLVLVGVALSAVSAETVGGFLAGLVATLGGYLAGLLALQVGMLVGASAFGVTVRSVVVGVGPRVLDRSTVKRAVVVRVVPVFLSVSIAPGRAPARPRMWGAAVCSAVAGIAATVAFALWWVIPAVACGLTVGHALVPRKRPASTSTGWLVVNLLRLTGDQAARLDAAPVVAKTVDATLDGDLTAAESLAARLAEEYPGLRTARAARVLVHQAHARYADGLLIAMAVLDEPDQTPAETAPFLAALAGLACDAVEAGQLDPAVGLPIAANALTSSAELGYPSHKLSGTRAQHALLTGDAATAVPLARQATQTNDDPLGRADDYATLARALMATHDNRAAREALAEAEKTAPWWPRVAATRQRLDV
jgi:hypothetical protein